MKTKLEHLGEVNPHAMIDDLIEPEELQFVVFAFCETLETLLLTFEQPSIRFMGHVISIVNNQLYIDGEPKVYGWTNSDGTDFLVLPVGSFSTRSLVINADEEFIVGDTAAAAINPHDDNLFVLRGNQLIIKAGSTPPYFNDQRQGKWTVIEDFSVGDTIVTPKLKLEKRRGYLRLTIFTDEVIFDPSKCLEVHEAPEYPKDYPEYRRSPRLHKEVSEKKYQISKIEPEEKMGSAGVWRALLPPLGMVAVMGLVAYFSKANPLMMLGMGTLSLFTGIFTIFQYFKDKKVYKKKNIKRKADYQSYLLHLARDIDRAHRDDKDILDYQLPTPIELSRMIAEFNSRIYERVRANKDFLDVTLGKGSIPSTLSITAETNDKENDGQSNQISDLLFAFSTHENAPMRLSVSNQSIGLVGPEKVTLAQLDNLLLQLAFFQSYHDMSFFVISDEETYKTNFKKWRMLPHFKDQNLNFLNMVYNGKTKATALSNLYQTLKTRQQMFDEAASKKPAFSPYIILVILDETMIAGHPIAEYLSEDLTHLSTSVIWIKKDKNLLPETVTAIVEYQTKNQGTLISDKGLFVSRDFAAYPKTVSLENTIRCLANLEHIEVEKSAIPKEVSFLELYKVRTVDDLNILHRWERANTSQTLAVPLGLRGKNDVVFLNLHERAHGPHGLVAGTTGSGKSEILQSYILSLAVNFAPEDVGFLPIDFKGGGMANLFKHLPHLMGSITNLDGAGVKRALASIRAELEKRQKLFTRFQVNHINDYTRFYKEGRNAHKGDYPTEPLPHLFLISDEFAELKTNYPDFMNELVSTARIGRSLGVHLILATQKPSGVVNDQIWSNSRFKLALKVENTSDSNEILKTPDAASITEPGRAYLQVGNNEVYELFQSAYSGAQYLPNPEERIDEDETIRIINDLGGYDEIDLGDLLTPPRVEIEEKHTQLEAIVDYIAELVQKTKATVPVKPWLPLPEKVSFFELYKIREAEELHISERWESSDASKSLAVPLGLRAKDDIVYLNLHERAHGPHGLVAGTTGSGKSEILQSYILSLAVNFSPEDVGFLPIDFKGGGMAHLFNGLPHLMGSITNLDGAGTQRALASIRAELKKRQTLFARYQVNHINDYTRLYKEGKRNQQPGNYPNEPLPHLFLISDEFAELKTNQPDFMTELVSAARIGRSLGVHLILATQKPSGVVNDQIWSNSRFKLALKVENINDSKEILKTPDAASIIEPGRAYLQVGNNEIYEYFQSAYSGAEYTPDSSSLEVYDGGDLDSSDEKQTQLDRVVAYIAKFAKDTHTIIPEKPWLPPLLERLFSPEVKNTEERNLEVPLGLLDLPSRQKRETYLFDLEKMSHTAIFSSPGYGKSIALQTLVMNLARQNTPEQVQFNLLDFGSNGLLILKDLPHVGDIVSLDESEKLDKMLTQILDEIRERKQILKNDRETFLTLPTLIYVFDSYDIAKDSHYADRIDAVMNAILLDGADISIYALASANRSNAFVSKMRANIKTKIVLKMSDKDETRAALGMTKIITIPDTQGRGQLLYKGLLSEIQIYLAISSEDEQSYQEALQDEIWAMVDKYKNLEQPKVIPMLPYPLPLENALLLPDAEAGQADNQIVLGFSERSTSAFIWKLQEDPVLLVASDNDEQAILLFQTITDNRLNSGAARMRKVLVDVSGDYLLRQADFDAYYDTDLSDLKSEILESLDKTEQERTLYYFVNADQALSELQFSSSEYKQFLKKGGNQMNFIFQMHNSSWLNAMDTWVSILRSRSSLGLFGVRLGEQRLVPVRSFRMDEEFLLLDELYVYRGKKVEKLRLPTSVD